MKREYESKDTSIFAYLGRERSRELAVLPLSHFCFENDPDVRFGSVQSGIEARKSAVGAQSVQAQLTNPF